jgi:hypothetical protein
MSATQPDDFNACRSLKLTRDAGRPRRGIPHAGRPVDIHGRGSHRVRGGFCFENP